MISQRTGLTAAAWFLASELTPAGRRAQRCASARRCILRRDGPGSLAPSPSPARGNSQLGSAGGQLCVQVAEERAAEETGRAVQHDLCHPTQRPPDLDVGVVLD